MRIAIYFTPLPSSLLHRLGSEWLGRNAWTGESVIQPEIQDLAVMTESPRRYGFHATLKPPFTLDDGVTEDHLKEAIERLCSQETSFEVRPRVGNMDGFLALVFDQPSGALQRIAERCVTELDCFRRPPSEAELARRRKTPLTIRQEAFLQQWGYPYVLEEFRFHMTLSGQLAPEALAPLVAAASFHFAPVLSKPVMIDGLTLFTEVEPGAPFTAIQHFPFQTPSPESAR